MRIHRYQTLLNGAAKSLCTKVDAYGVFFPLASVYAMLALPVSVYTLSTGRVLLPGLTTPLQHAHELLFGYALAVTIGFLLNRVPVWWIGGLLAAWISARASYLIAPHSVVSGISNILFALGFLLAGTSRFLPAAKKWRNRMFGVNIIILGLACVGAHVIITGTPLQTVYMATYEAVLMLALLMLLMGGRFIAPAAAGCIQKRGGRLDARVQPRLEGAIILLLMAGAILFPLLPQFPGLPLALAGMLAFVRLARWRLWECIDQTDLVCLGVGYAWVALGLILAGTSLLFSGSMVVALHAITAGGIGTLTVTVMTRTWMQRSGATAAHSKTLAFMVALVAAAAGLRLMSGLIAVRYIGDFWMAAAICWSAAFVLLITRVFLMHPLRTVAKKDFS